MTEDKKAFILKMAMKEKGEWNSDCEYAGEYFRSAWQDNVQQTFDYKKGQMIYIDAPPRSPTCSYVVKCTRTEYKDFIESLFKDAPEDAEFYLTGDHKTYPCWIKSVNANVCNYIVLVSTDYSEHKNDAWESFKSDGVLKRGGLIPRPRKQEVDQVEWMPDIGEECLVSNCGSDFEECTPKYLSSTYAIVEHDYGEQHYHRKNVEFRPLKTEEEKERERLAINLFFVMTESEMSSDDAKTIALFKDCLKAIDAGWRPQK